MIQGRGISKTLGGMLLSLLCSTAYSQGIADGSFEGLAPGNYQGNPAVVGAWKTYTPVAIDNTLAHDGSQSLTLFDLSSVAQQVDTVPGMKYQLSWWSRPSGSGITFGAYIRADGWGAEGQEAGFRVAQDWTGCALSFTASGTKTTLGFIADGQQQLDGVRLVAIPEPASISLLALGTMALVWGSSRRGR